MLELLSMTGEYDATLEAEAEGDDTNKRKVRRPQSRSRLLASLLLPVNSIVAQLQEEKHLSSSPHFVGGSIHAAP